MVESMSANTAYGKRTRAALNWLAEDDGRTQQQAADKFGISQPTIAGAIARSRASCPTCGHKVRNGAVMPAAHVAQRPGLTTLRALADAVNTYAWHLGTCPAYGDDAAECACGFAEAAQIARGVL